MGSGASRENPATRYATKPIPDTIVSVLSILTPQYCEFDSASKTKFLCGLQATHEPAKQNAPSYSTSAYNSNEKKYLKIQCLEFTTKKLYSKTLTENNLREIKATADSMNQCNWRQFMEAIKASFLYRTLTVTLNDSTTVCQIQLEITLRSNQCVLSINLRPFDGDVANEIATSFAKQLADFYFLCFDSPTPDERFIEMQNHLKKLKSRIAELEATKEENPSPTTDAPQAPNNATLSKPPTTISEPINQTVATSHKVGEIPSTKDDLYNIPAEDLVKFLKELKRRVLQTNGLTPEDSESLDQVFNLIAFDNMFRVSIEQKELKEMDPQVLRWLKKKFLVDERKNDSDAQNVQREYRNHYLQDQSEFNKEVDRANFKEDGLRSSMYSMFDTIDEWNFDVFALNDLTGGRTLFVTAYTLFLKYDLLRKFHIEEETLRTFLTEVERSYHPNPYHNSLHAADVTQVIHYIIHKGKLGERMTDEDIFAALIGAIVHDLDHPGLNNAFQVNSQSYLATLYNDVSVLENYHVSQAFELCKSNPKANIFANLSEEQFKDIRGTIVEMVLSTDMSQHAAITSRFKSKVEAEADNFDFRKKEDLRLALSLAVKIADVSNPARPPKLSILWAERISEEFFTQGDKEKEFKIPVSPFMDREKPTLAKLQLGFINYIIMPMFETFVKFLPEMSFCLDYINQNKQYWNQQLQIEQQ